MRSEFRELRLKQLSRSLVPFEQARLINRPRRGWLRAVREATGLTRRQVAQSIEVTPQLLATLEKSEAHDRITLHSLEKVAEAMGCQLVYAIVPKSGTLQDLAEKRTRDKAAEDVKAVEHTMALENQAVGNVEEKIAQETKKRLRRR
jgi:predicted DNA-binding mobile mystery protein A